MAAHHTLATQAWFISILSSWNYPIRRTLPLASEFPTARVYILDWVLGTKAYEKSELGAHIFLFVKMPLQSYKG